MNRQNDLHTDVLLYGLTILTLGFMIYSASAGVRIGKLNKQLEQLRTAYSDAHADAARCFASEREALRICLSNLEQYEHAE